MKGLKAFSEVGNFCIKLSFDKLTEARDCYLSVLFLHNYLLERNSKTGKPVSISTLFRWRKPSKSECTYSFMRRDMTRKKITIFALIRMNDGISHIYDLQSQASCCLVLLHSLIIS